MGTEEQYSVIATYIKNGKTQKQFWAGEVVTDRDFPKPVLQQWAVKIPPVVAKVEKNGSDS